MPTGYSLVATIRTSIRGTQRPRDLGRSPPPTRSSPTQRDESSTTANVTSRRPSPPPSIARTKHTANNKPRLQRARGQNLSNHPQSRKGPDRKPHNLPLARNRNLPPNRSLSPNQSPNRRSFAQPRAHDLPDSRTYGEPLRAPSPERRTSSPSQRLLSRIDQRSPQSL